MPRILGQLDEVVAPCIARAHILVVDDEIQVGKALARLLVRNGHSVDVATGGAEALVRLAERAPDLLITDLKMPGMNGLELIAAARQRHPGLPCALVSGHAESGTTLPDVVFLEKPWRRETLLSHLEGLLSKERSQ